MPPAVSSSPAVSGNIINGSNGAQTAVQYIPVPWYPQHPMAVAPPISMPMQDFAPTILPGMGPKQSLQHDAVQPSYTFPHAGAHYPAPLYPLANNTSTVTPPPCYIMWPSAQTPNGSWPWHSLHDMDEQKGHKKGADATDNSAQFTPPMPLSGASIPSSAYPYYYPLVFSPYQQTTMAMHPQYYHRQQSPQSPQPPQLSSLLVSQQQQQHQHQLLHAQQHPSLQSNQQTSRDEAEAYAQYVTALSAAMAVHHQQQQQHAMSLTLNDTTVASLPQPCSVNGGQKKVSHQQQVHDLTESNKRKAEDDTPPSQEGGGTRPAKKPRAPRRRPEEDTTSTSKKRGRKPTLSGTNKHAPDTGEDVTVIASDTFALTNSNDCNIGKDIVMIDNSIPSGNIGNNDASGDASSSHKNNLDSTPKPVFPHITATCDKRESPKQTPLNDAVSRCTIPRVPFYTEATGKPLPVLTPWNPMPEAVAHIRELLRQKVGEGRDVFDVSPVASPINITECDLVETVATQDYVVSPKNDGVHFTLVMVKHGETSHAFLMDRGGRRFSVRVVGPPKLFDLTVCEGEMCPAQKPNTACPFEFIIFEAHFIAGNEVRKWPEARRSAERKRLFYDPAWEDENLSASDRAKLLALPPARMPGGFPRCRCLTPGMRFRYKESVHKSQIRSVVARLERESAWNDGLIFTPCNAPVPMGTWRQQFKWKQHHTLDFELFADHMADGVTNDGVIDFGPHAGRCAVDAWACSLMYVVPETFAQSNDPTATSRCESSPSFLADACVRGVPVTDREMVPRVIKAVIHPTDALRGLLRGALAAGHTRIRAVVECSWVLVTPGSFMCRVLGQRPDKWDGNNRATIAGTLRDNGKEVTVEKIVALLDRPRTPGRTIVASTTNARDQKGVIERQERDTPIGVRAPQQQQQGQEQQNQNQNQNQNQKPTEQEPEHEKTHQITGNQLQLQNAKCGLAKCATESEPCHTVPEPTTMTTTIPRPYLLETCADDTADAKPYVITPCVLRPLGTEVTETERNTTETETKTTLFQERQAARPDTSVTTTEGCAEQEHNKETVSDAVIDDQSAPLTTTPVPKAPRSNLSGSTASPVASSHSALCRSLDSSALLTGEIEKKPIKRVDSKPRRPHRVKNTLHTAADDKSTGSTGSSAQDS